MLIFCNKRENKTLNTTEVGGLGVPSDGVWSVIHGTISVHTCIILPFNVTIQSRPFLQNPKLIWIYIKYTIINNQFERFDLDGNFYCLTNINGIFGTNVQDEIIF